MKQPHRRFRGLLTSYLWPHRRLAGVLTALLAGSIALQLVNPQILRYFIDTARTGGTLRALTGAAILFLLVAIATQVISVGETYVAENLGWLATNRLRADLALHCLKLDPSFHGSHTPGALIERIDGDVFALSNFFSRFVVYVLGNVLLLAGVLVLLFRIDWRVGATVTGFSVVSLLVIHSLRGVAERPWRAARQSSAELFGFIEERIAGTEDIRSSGATAYTMRRLYERLRQLLHTQRRAELAGTAIAWATILLYVAGTAAALALGAWLFQAGRISIGTVYLIFAYTQMLNQPIEEITRQLSDLQTAAASVARVQELLAMRTVIRDGRGDLIPTGALSVDFEHVSFGYDDEGLVLHDISLHLQPGQVLGVLGRTGSGKTSLSRLLFRLYDPSEGRVCLGKVDLRDAKLDHLRRRIGMVTQDIQLFHASIRDNLTFFDPSISDDRVREVLIDLELWEWCAALPEGLDTKLSGSNSALSAGEAQLLAFARVFLQDPGVVVLDEASSRLDPATEHRIEHAVDRLLRGRTAIVIAHRLGTVRRADDILILDHGRVCEYGPRAALAADPASRFAQLQRAGLEGVPA